MRRALAALLVLIALPLAAAEKWYDAYSRGVAAVRSKSYEAAAEALQRAVAEMPEESGAARTNREIITYTPHFWLGIARFNLGDIDGSLREWKTSEEQGVVQNTPYYAQLREWVARANTEKQRRIENAAADSKREANGALGRAVSAQMDAVAAGADRSDGYRAAQRKLQDALEANGKAGTDIRAYKRAADLASQAREMFAGAAEQAKKEKAARPVVVARATPPPRPKPIEIVVPMAVPTTPAPQPAPASEAVATAAPAPAPVESEALVRARLAVQEYHRHLIEMHLAAADALRLERELAGAPDEKAIGRLAADVAQKERALEARRAPKQKPVEVVTAAPAPVIQPQPQPDPRARLESAYRAFAAGDLAGSEQLLTQILASAESPEAYLLRGCARYTQALLSRNNALLESAAGDFRSALKLNRALRLDRAAFSPKLVAYFDQLRASS